MRLNKASLRWLILLMGAFLLFTPSTFSQFSFDTNCQQAYKAIFSLRFSEAHKLIGMEKKAAPDNLVPVYLENYIDFLTLIIGEERKVYDRLKDQKGERVNALEKGRSDSPYYHFCLGEVHLQWALARLKFGDYAAAAFEIRKAHACFSANDAKFPSFLINKLGLGVVNVIVSLVPDNYKWVGNLIGLTGSMEQGIGEIRKVAEYSGTDRITRMYKPQASFYLAFLTLNLQKNKKEAMPLLDLLHDHTPGVQSPESPLLIFARATILMKNGLNDDALAVLQERVSLPQTFRFSYLDYLEGIARLNRLDDSAAVCFNRFVAGFSGRNYLGSAYQKLAWITILHQDTGSYYQWMKQVLAKGKSAVDEDKQAQYEAEKGIAPNLILLRARLLFDGGYYNRAMSELLNNPVKSAVKTKRDLVEYTYRLGRIYHEMGNYPKALENYQLTITRGKAEQYYYAAGAAYQMGLLYENAGTLAKAENAYNTCLAIKPVEYKTSLHQKAKAGLNRLKVMQPKT